MTLTMNLVKIFFFKDIISNNNNIPTVSCWYQKQQFFTVSYYFKTIKGSKKTNIICSKSDILTCGCK